jgi:hypothetical protein
VLVTVEINKFILSIITNHDCFFFSFGKEEKRKRKRKRKKSKGALNVIVSSPPLSLPPIYKKERESRCV